MALLRRVPHSTWITDMDNPRLIFPKSLILKTNVMIKDVNYPYICFMYGFS